MAPSLTSEAAASLAVIGYGNPMRQDDGIGQRAAELLRQSLPPERVTVIAEHQLTPELAVALNRVQLVIFLDAAIDLQPGAIRLRTLHPAEVHPWSHHILPAQLLRFAERFNGEAPRAFLITGGVAEMGLAEAPTPVGAECAARMAQLAKGLLMR